MNNKFADSNLITIQLIIRDDCRICQEVKHKLERYCKSRKGVILEVLDLGKCDTTPNGKQPHITPGIWVNDTLWSLGNVDIARFDERINQLIGELTN